MSKPLYRGLRLSLLLMVVTAACEGNAVSPTDPAASVTTVVTGAAFSRVGPPSKSCTVPPEIHRITSKPMTEPAPGAVNTGTFRLIGRNFQGGDVFVDGPLVVVGPARVNPVGTLIQRDWVIGCCAPEPGAFNVFVVTPCGSDQITFPISGANVPG